MADTTTNGTADRSTQGSSSIVSYIEADILGLDPNDNLLIKPRAPNSEIVSLPPGSHPLTPAQISEFSIASKPYPGSFSYPSTSSSTPSPSRLAKTTLAAATAATVLATSAHTCYLAFQAVDSTIKHWNCGTELRATIDELRSLEGGERTSVVWIGGEGYGGTSPESVVGVFGPGDEERGQLVEVRMTEREAGTSGGEGGDKVVNLRLSGEALGQAAW
ncbi:hypothetical protein IAT38_007675 [Cryptococcus sp. DSM 104549]